MAPTDQPKKPDGKKVNLRPATQHEWATLAKIGDRAFEDDAHTLMKSRVRSSHQPQPSTTQGDDPMMHEFSRLMKRPERYDLIVATTEEDGGEIMGFVIWAKWGYNQDGIQPTTKVEGVPPSAPPTPQVKNVESLEEMTNTSMSEWVEYFMPDGSKCRYIQGISVDPRFQGQGVGSALIRWGTEQADRDGVFCWVHSSMGAWKMFEKQGFREKGRLEVDLNEYAEGVEKEADPEHSGSGKSEWGTYTWRYLVREPQRIELIGQAS